jgi:hypothetical protein
VGELLCLGQHRPAQLNSALITRALDRAGGGHLVLMAGIVILRAPSMRIRTPRSSAMPVGYTTGRRPSLARPRPAAERLPFVAGCKWLVLGRSAGDFFYPFD